MKKRWLAVFTIIAALCFFTPTVMAKGGKSKEHGKAHAGKHFDKEHHGEHADRGHGKGEHHWEQHDGFEHAVFHDGRPPGWSRGKKTGWGNCGLPPGHARKGECRTYVYQGCRHYYYHDDYGRIVVRRPIMHVHAGVDIVR